MYLGLSYVIFFGAGLPLREIISCLLTHTLLSFFSSFFSSGFNSFSIYLCNSASSSSVKSSISSSSGSSCFFSNQSHAKNHPPINSSDFNTSLDLDLLSSFSFLSLPSSFQFFSSNFFIFNKFASETVTVLDINSFHITFS